MEEAFYNILWIDDEHETLSGTKGRAKRNGINLIGFKSLNGGMGELERNYPFYDGVLLDAKFFENEDDKEGSEDTYNVHRAKEQLLLLKKKFEIFILTGQAEAYEDKTFAKAFTKVYKKGSDQEIDRLFADIKTAAKSQEDTQLRHAFKRVFDVCKEKYIGEYAGQDILYLLKINNESEVDKNLSTIRDIVQDLFTAFYKFNLLPNEFVNPSVALNESSKFLAGKGKDGYFIEKGYKHLDETHLPKVIASFLRNILEFTQPGSHRSVIDNHIRTVSTHFLMKSLLFQVMDVLVWFKIYLESNPKKGNWIRIKEDTESAEPNTWIEGHVKKYNPIKGYAFLVPNGESKGVFIPPELIDSFSLKEGDKVKGEVEKYFNHRLKELSTRIKNIEFK